MAAERTLSMQIVELHAEDLVTAMDVVGALKRAIGADISASAAASRCGFAPNDKDRERRDPVTSRAPA